jgi:SAM-dependent methyltransferase
MNDPALQAQTDSATAHQELFVPALFQEWAPRMVAAARIQPRDRVLDVACGTGVLAREAASHVGSTGSVAGLDPNPGMLTVAARLAPAIEWRRGTAESLPYADRSFDVVVSQFGLMFFTDQRQAVREMLRVLAPGGRLAIAVWDCLDNTPAYAAEVALLVRLAGQRAAEALRAPFVLGERQELEALFAGLGQPSLTITTHHGTGQFPSIRSMVEADVQGWLLVMGVVLTEDVIGRILTEAENALRPYLAADGRVMFDSPAHIVAGTKA